MTIFRTVREAIDRGYEVLHRIPEGYLVRTRTRRGWALAIVDVRGVGGLGADPRPAR